MTAPLCICGDPKSSHIRTKEDIRCWRCFMAGRPICFGFQPARVTLTNDWSDIGGIYRPSSVS